MEQPHTISISEADGVASVVIGGEISHKCATDIRQQICAQMRNETSQVVIDLDAVEFIDSVGIGALIACCNEAARRGISFAVVRPQRRVHRFLEILGVLDYLHVEEPPQPAPAGDPAPTV